jgi:hypothetical protein
MTVCTMTLRRSALGVALGFLPVFPLHAADDAVASALKPHRAVYAMGLANSTGTGGPIDVRGVMYYEMSESCEAWKIDTRVLMRSNYPNAEEEIENLRKMTTWEAKDGLGFRFRLDETTQGQPGDKLRGVAVIDAAGSPGVAEFTEPKNGQSELPKGSMFPTHHMVELIKRSTSGAAHYTTVVFDGASVEDPYEVSALIGEAPESNLSDAVRKTLGEGARWKARLAYFPVAKRAETPEYELSVLYRDDGIVENVRQDYDDHSIEARLRQIEILPRPVCQGPTPPMPLDHEQDDGDETTE